MLSGQTGRYLYRVASGKTDINYNQKCKDWFNSQDLSTLYRKMVATLPCPCDLRLASRDNRWKQDTKPAHSGTQMTCYYQRNLRTTKATQV